MLSWMPCECGFVCGKGGKNHKRIMETHDCRVNMMSEASIRSCRVKSHLDQNPFKCKHSTWYYGYIIHGWSVSSFRRWKDDPLQDLQSSFSSVSFPEDGPEISVPLSAATPCFEKGFLMGKRGSNMKRIREKFDLNQDQLSLDREPWFQINSSSEPYFRSILVQNQVQLWRFFEIMVSRGW